MTKPLIRIRNIWSVVENIPYEVKQELYEHLSFMVPGSQYSDKFIGNVIDPEKKKSAWDGKIHLYKKRTSTFLTGLVYRTAMFFVKEYNITPEIIWETKKPEKTLDLPWNDEKFKIRTEYQSEVVEKCIKKGRGVIECCTGSGKTIMVAKIIQELGVSPFIFYVLTKDLMYQSKDKLEEAIPGLEVGLIGDGCCKIRDINIVTVQTATTCYLTERTDKNIKKQINELAKSANFEELEVKEFKKEKLDHISTEEKRNSIKNLIMDAVGIYADEVHHFSAKTCKDVMLKSPNAYYRLGGSATPQRADNSYLTIEGLFGRKVSIVTASDLIRQKFLVGPTIRFLDLKQKPFLVNSWAEDRKTHIVENEKRNDYIVRLAQMLISQGIKTMILVQLISHGKILKKRLPGSIFLHGSSPKKERRQVLIDFTEGKVPLLIGSVIADEGLDLPCLSGLILAGGGKAATRAKQRVGRAIRVDPLVPYSQQKSLIFDFMDKGRWVESHSWERMQILKEEEEFDVEIVSAENALVVQKELF